MATPFETTASLLNRPAIRELSLGYMEVRLLTPDELKDAQIGYAIAVDCKNLTGNQPGDWQPGWIVIGHDCMCGDPIFVDSDAKDFPVFTAMHGTGEWDPTLIAPSFEAFIQLLSALKQIASGREHPAALESNPVPEDVQEEFLGMVSSVCSGDVPDFWESWFETE